MNEKLKAFVKSIQKRLTFQLTIFWLLLVCVMALNYISIHKIEHPYIRVAVSINSMLFLFIGLMFISVFMFVFVHLSHYKTGRYFAAYTLFIGFSTALVPCLPLNYPLVNITVIMLTLVSCFLLYQTLGLLTQLVKKLFKKRLTLILVAVLFIPAFYTFSVMTDAPLLQMTPSGALDFALAQWDLLGMTGLLQILFSLITASSFSSEIEKGQIQLSVMRLCSRKKIVWAKAIALAVFSWFCYATFMLLSLLCYYVFIIRTPYGTGEWTGEVIRLLGVEQFFVGGWFPLMDIYITMGIVYIFSLRYKSGICFMLAVGTSLALEILQFIPAVKYLVPAHANMLLNYAKITVGTAGVLCLIFVMAASLLVLISARKFERMDLK
jgi:ABC-type transport system involved in multi-copper enzyme maturation permease subunit